MEAYLSNPDIQIRTVASQALSSLISPEQAVEKAKVTATRISHSSMDLNLVHGRLKFLQRLITDVIQWEGVSKEDRRILEDRMRESLWQQRNPTIVTAALDCVNAYASLVEPITPSLPLITKEIALSSLKRSKKPAVDLLCASAAQALLTSHLVDLLHPSMPEDVHLTALEHLNNSDYTVATLKALISLCQAPVGDAVHTAVYEALTASPPNPEFESNQEAIADIVWTRYHKTRCVPLKEAALAVMGRVSSGLASERIQKLAELICEAAAEDRVSFLYILG